MKHSLSHGAGYVLVDHRNSPGLTPQDVAHMPGVVAVPGGMQYERDVMQCSHCQRGVALNPGRVRARAVCPKCHHYICDGCEAIRAASGGECVPFKAVLDHAEVIIAKHGDDPLHPALSVLDHPEMLARPKPTVAISRNDLAADDSAVVP